MGDHPGRSTLVIAAVVVVLMAVVSLVWFEWWVVFFTVPLVLCVFALGIIYGRPK